VITTTYGWDGPSLVRVATRDSDFTGSKPPAAAVGLHC
jgi:hypothetical protein